MAEKYIAAGQAATLLGVHADTLRRWVDEGRLEAVRTLGGHRRYLLSDIQALLGTQGTSTVSVPCDLLRQISEISEETGVSVDSLVEKRLRASLPQSKPARSLKGNSVVLDSLGRGEDHD